MRKSLLILTAAALLLGVAGGVLAQNYLDVPPDPNFAKDYLNSVIYGDTTDTGERIPDRVYRLQVGGIYYFNNIIKTDGWDLKIVAEGEGTPQFSKAIILTGRNDQGKQPARFADVHGDVLFKNLYFSCISDNEKQVNDLVRVYKDDAVITMENCFVEWLKLHVFRIYSSNTSLYIRDSYFRNITVIGGPFNGKIANFEDNPVKEVVLENNTIANVQGITFKMRFNTVEHFKFNHNTVVNTLKWPFHFEYWTNGEVTNNIFFNAAAYGENRVDASNQDQEGLMFGMINLYTVPDSLLAQVGMSSQGERKMEVRNNVFYFDQDVKDYIAKWWASDSVREEPWMNERTQSWFDDDENYPYLNGEAPIIEDVQFAEYPTADSMIKKMDQWRTDGQKTTWFWVDDDGDKVSNPTDRPHDLSYSTGSTAYTASDGGFPLGDLNWFPEKKAEWEEWMTGVARKKAGNAPVDFALAQNYPNPFNPETTIEYTLKSAGKATLTIYNTLGQEVRRLVDKKQAAGVYEVQWDATNNNGEQLPSGIYYYKLKVDEQSLVGKMALMR